MAGFALLIFDFYGETEPCYLILPHISSIFVGETLTLPLLAKTEMGAEKKQKNRQNL